MKLIKSTEKNNIFQRRDGRYAVQTKKGTAVNGDDKAAILADNNLVKVATAAPVKPEIVEQSPVEAAVAETTTESEAPADSEVEELAEAEQTTAAEVEAVEKADKEKADKEKVDKEKANKK